MFGIHDSVSNGFPFLEIRIAKNINQELAAPSSEVDYIDGTVLIRKLLHQRGDRLDVLENHFVFTSEQ